MLPRRILSIWCRDLAIDHWRLGDGNEQADATPLALITETAHGPRIAALNRAGLETGAQPGTMLADARALCPGIATAPSDHAGDLALIENLAVWAQRWGPWSAIDPPDGVIVDVTGAAHLFGGERALIGDAAMRFARRGFATRLAIASTAGAAWALAHHGPEAAILEPDDDPAERLAVLPVAALRLDAATVLLLRRLGLKRLGDLHGVARKNLTRRFRHHSTPAANPLIRMDQLIGRVPEPLLPVIAHDAPMVERRLMEPIRHRELLDRVIADLCADMARLLEGRAQGARRLELGFWRVDGEVVVRSLELAAASRDPAHIAGLLGRKLDDIDAGLGIELARLRSAWIEPLALSQRDFEEGAEARGTSLATCIDRLTARLGAQAVRRPVPQASHLPERAQRWQLPLEPVRGQQDEFEFHARPVKLLDRAEPIGVVYLSPDGLPRRFRWRGEVHEIARVEGPERIAPEWWRERSTTRLRDYYRIEDEQGRRYWIYRSGLPDDGRGGVPAWFLQGLCG